MDTLLLSDKAEKDEDIYSSHSIDAANKVQASKRKLQIKETGGKA